MKEKSFPRKCPNCRQRAVSPLTADYTRRIEHDGRSYDVVVTQLSHMVCAACGDHELDLDALDRLTVALRTSAGLLPPDEIRAKRLSLNLTQKAIAEQLDIAEATLSRWETGAQIQQRAFDTLLRAYFAVPELRRYLSRPVTTPQRTIECPHPAALPEPALS